MTDKNNYPVAIVDSEFRQPFLKALLGSALDCILCVDTNSRILEFNPAAETTFGYSRQDVLGLSMVDLIIPPGLREAHIKGMQEYLRTGEGPVLNQRIEITGMRADGSEFPVELSIVPIDAEGQTFFVGYIRDLSEIKAAQTVMLAEEAREAEARRMEMVGQLAGGVAHDLNNMLSVILGNAENLRTDDASNADVEAIADDIYESGKRAAVLTRKLLEFSQRMPMNPSKTSLRAVAEESESLSASAESKQLVFRSDYRVGDVECLVDRQQLAVCLNEIFDNAVDASEEGGEISVTIEEVLRNETDRFFEIRVSDQGCGMSAEFARRAFEPFSTTKPFGTSKGLGLSRVHGFAHQVGGYVELDSELGAGTTVVLGIPKSLA